MRPLRSLAAAFLALLLGACSSPGVERYRAERPALDLRTYLNGTIDAWGIFQDRSGEVKRRFHVLIEARWQGDVGTLDEHFTWSDGSRSRRLWTLTRQPDGRYVGRADDVLGEAIGEVAGNALRWRYVLALPVDARTWHVDLDDWMFLVDDKVMLNRSYMSKWGIALGEISLTFVKR